MDGVVSSYGAECLPECLLAWDIQLCRYVSSVLCYILGFFCLVAEKFSPLSVLTGEVRSENDRTLPNPVLVMPPIEVDTQLDGPELVMLIANSGLLLKLSNSMVPLVFPMMNAIVFILFVVRFFGIKNILNYNLFVVVIAVKMVV
ncbi:uncharacterized protein [Rutidosis leptorrhynchoides]|uniref:uncharacterized protein isoform X1 n=1 Tax=Rutidosis leptorrhynchoides TaxID=125765 RepID=UPI003A9A1905